MTQGRSDHDARTGSSPGRRARRLAAVALPLLTGFLAACADADAGAFGFPGTARLPPACIATVNTVALQVMNRTNPLGQMQIFGDPAVFDPHLLRVTVTVFGARTDIYSVDLTIDDACRVLSASTRLESNEWPYR
ncbi:hypothetical protein DFR50_15726 [Roseiarcus fermentans]|uniref:Lipoprotein n=1 Tax=Roseiarcus fermentans TaxID=1473586 RepID=A0A366EFT8_9HYPH|nr:hypothetical protein [Roseiarcus fermentans]RBP01264.1 hypothetical protein DFR50_15726 [Roseiarcus fermentans]